MEFDFCNIKHKYKTTETIVFCLHLNKLTKRINQLQNSNNKNFAALAVKVIKNYNLELDVCIMAWYLENNVYTYNVKNCCYVR